MNSYSTAELTYTPDFEADLYYISCGNTWDVWEYADKYGVEASIISAEDIQAVDEAVQALNEN